MLQFLADPIDITAGQFLGACALCLFAGFPFGMMFLRWLERRDDAFVLKRLGVSASVLKGS